MIARRRQGFTLLEMTIVLSIISVLVPILYAMHRSFDARSRVGEMELTASEATQEVSESLRLDLRTLHLVGTRGFELAGPCAVTYQVEAGSLWRRAPAACGGDRVLATRVAAFSRAGGRVELDFRQAIDAAGPDPTLRFLIGVVP